MKYDPVIHLVTLTVALFIFALGFFPYQAPVVVKNERRQDQLGMRQDKVVIMLIDALRSDFVFEASHMKYLNELTLKNMTRNFIAIATPPTVTMPRIKAITSGIKPGFIDVLLNFNSPELRVDNMIQRATDRGYRIVFYGDDTWLKLFPRNFQRHETVSSFYVKDYTEVDDNVTRNVFAEMKRVDWDIMIMHYLGLDHIGHLYGPKSPLIPNKLQEMDEILHHVAQKMLLQSGNSKGCPLIILMGDHGMSDAGSHGGASKHELATPLIFISHASCLSSGFVSSSSPEEVNQVDIPSTLSVLLNLSIPDNNIGKLITPALFKMNNEQLMKALTANIEQLTNVMKANNIDLPSDFRYLNGDNRDKIEHYLNILKAMSFSLSSKGGYFDMLQMLVALFITFKVFVMVVLSFWDYHDYPQICMKLGTLLTTILIGVVISFTFCYLGSIESGLCELSLWNCLKLIVLITTAVYDIEALFRKRGHVTSNQIRNALRKLTEEETLMVIFFLSHPFILLSTSFIEEEHQLFYFMLTTVHTIMLIKSVLDLWKFKSNHYVRPEALSQSIDILSWERPNKAATHVLGIVMLLTTFSYLRKFNQTGDKWLHMPDLGDWLSSNTYVLAVGMLLSLLWIISFGITHNNYWCVGDYFILMLVCYIHLSNLMATSSNSASFAPLVGFIVILIRACHTWYICPKSVFGAVFEFWVLLLCLLLKHHNVVTLGLTVLLQKMVNRMILLGLFQTPRTLTLYMLLWAYAGFFYQGNSNSLSSLDVSTGYAVFPVYNIFLNGVSVYCHTYGIFFLWCIFTFHMMQKFCTENLLMYERYHNEVLQTLLATRCLTLVVFISSLIYQRYHLFVWTVFAPKLLYEIAHTVTLVFASIVSFCYTQMKYKSNE